MWRITWPIRWLITWRYMWLCTWLCAHDLGALKTKLKLVGCHDRDCCREDMVASSSPPRQTAWLGIGGKGLDIYWSTCKGEGFLMGCLMVVTSGGMIRWLGWGAAIVRLSCSFIELIGVGVGDAHIGCTPNVVMLFWGAEMPRTVGATVG